MHTKRLRTETLERRDLLAADTGFSTPLSLPTDSLEYHPPEFALSVIANLGTTSSQFDLDLDGRVSPIDALVAVNRSQAMLGGDSRDDPHAQRSTNDDHVDQIGPAATVISLQGPADSRTGHGFGFLEQPGDVDVFQFDNVAGTEFFLVGLPSVQSLKVQLYDANAQLIGESQSLEPFLPVDLSGMMSTGLYYVAVSASDGVSTGDYFVDVWVGTPGTGGDPVDDHVDQVGPNATQIVLDGGGKVQHGLGHGVIESAGDVDVFQFAAVAAEPLELMMHPTGLATKTVTLLDPTTGATSSASSSNPHEPIHLNWNLAAAGTYYVIVEATDGTSTGDYMFDLQLGDPGDPDPPEDDHVNVIGPDATPLFVDRGEEFLHGDGPGVLEDLDDVDVFKFSLVAPAQISAFALPHGVQAQASYSVLDELGNTLFDFTENIPTTQTLGVGTYYVSVSGASEANVPYFFMLLAERHPAAADVMGKLGALALNPL